MHSAVKVILLEAAPGAAQPLRERLCACGLNPVRRTVSEAAQDPAWVPPDVAVIVTGARADGELAAQTAKVLSRLLSSATTTIYWGSPDNVPSAGDPRVDWLDPRVSLDEVVGRLSTLTRYVPLVHRLERELVQVQRLGEQLNRYFAEIDQEMRLAGRLQRDFLPPELPETAGLRLAALYRPASWVSGDMYDAFRIDERHVGLFVADAMGHGVAAGLVTMFLRQALVPRELRSGSYAVSSPREVILRLHECLVRQKLPNCQFVTAVYAVYDAQSRELRLARAGHPYPLHVRATGEVLPIALGGSLLGLPDMPPEFEELHLTLARGDKVLFYSDGLEEDLFGRREHADANTTPLAARPEWFQESATGLVEVLAAHLDGKEGSLHPADDQTLLILEVP